MAQENVRNVKFPRLESPKFNGNVLEWPTFWDSFESTYDKSKLADVDKFKYLFASLEGDAKDTLRGFNLTGAQYAAAVDQLKKRYDDKELILHTNYDKLAALPRSKNSTGDFPLPLAIN